MPRFDRLATLYLSFPLTCFLGPRQRTRVPILMYHSISDYLFGMSHPYYHINTLPEVFSQQMRWLRNRGYRAVDLAEAWGVLKQCGFNATIFLTTDRIRNTPARIEGVEYLTWSEVRELQAAGMRL